MKSIYAKELYEADKIIIDNYNEIAEYTYKGTDPNNYVFIDMKGNYELLRIFTNRKLPKTLSIEEYNQAVKLAINNAIKNIKKERIEVIENIFNIENGDN